MPRAGREVTALPRGGPVDLAAYSSPVTGHRKGATTAIRCIGVGALVAVAIVRANPKAEVIPFEEKIVPVEQNPRDSVLTTPWNAANARGTTFTPEAGCDARIAQARAQEGAPRIRLPIPRRRPFSEKP